MEIVSALIDDDEDLLLLNITNPQVKKRRLYYKQRKRTAPFNMNDLTDDFCWIHFRFLKSDLFRLKAALKIPDLLKCRKRVSVGGMEALCMLLKRLAYPNRYYDIMSMFPRTRCQISRIVSQLIFMLTRLHGHRLKSLDQQWLSIQNIQRFTEVLFKKGCPYRECFGFLDGTVRPICRPRKNQKQYYNGHRRIHAIQSLLVPNGLIAHLGGPVVGRRHDGYLLQSSNLMQQLGANCNKPDGTPYHLYGDPAYPLLHHLITPFKAHNFTPARANCNKIMSSIRESVEWGFGKVIQLFGFLDYRKNLKIGKQPIHEYYTNKLSLLYL